jgi:glycosyltransferase involved in cell wall biosynthesis
VTAEGISVVVCSHNGAVRLPTTLLHLKSQVPSEVPWEVLLVDNASTDDTAEVARACWEGGPVPLRVINEPHLGVRYARERGFLETNREYLAFVDDDNWLADDWVATAYQILAADSRLGAVGSVLIPACQVPSPPWFENFHSSFAVLTYSDLLQMSQPPKALPTAGLCIRKRAWEMLVQNGFHFLLSGSVGADVQGGEDTELTLALRLSGWDLRIDPRLRLQHFMSARRLRWDYLRKLLRNYGASHVALDAYTEHSLYLPKGPRRWLSERWWYQLGKTGLKMARHPFAAVAALSGDSEGQNEVIEVEQQFGRAAGLIRLKGRYGALRREVREAPWLSHGSSEDAAGATLKNERDGGAIVTNQNG